MRPVPITQFLYPNGEKRDLVCDVSDYVAAMYEEVIYPLGLRITAECLQGTPIVSMCLEEPKLGDYSCVLATNSKEEPGIVKDALEALIRRFDIQEFEFWKAQQLGAEEEDL
jgi:hypothetical protein